MAARLILVQLVLVRVQVPLRSGPLRRPIPSLAPLCSGLARRPLKAVARVRIPSGLPRWRPWPDTGPAKASVISGTRRHPASDSDPAIHEVPCRISSKLVTPVRRANSTSCTRSLDPVFDNNRPTWVLTVGIDSQSRSQISWFVKPAATSARTSLSLGVICSRPRRSEGRNRTGVSELP